MKSDFWIIFAFLAVVAGVLLIFFYHFIFSSGILLRKREPTKSDWETPRERVSLFISYFFSFSVLAVALLATFYAWRFMKDAMKHAFSFSSYHELIPIVMLASGLILSFLLFFILYFLVSSRLRAVRLAEAMTRDLRERTRDAEEAHENLKESEERYRSLAEMAHDGIITSDAMGIIISWNKGAEAIFGYTADQAVGQPLTILMPSRFQNAHAATFAWAVQSGERRLIGKTLELTGLKKNGGEFQAELSLSSWKTKETVFFSAIVRDITERKRTEQKLRENESRFRSLIENSSDLITLLDAKGEIQYESPSIQRILGYAPDELVGKIAFDLVHPEDRVRILGFFVGRLAVPGATAAMEYRFQHKNGSWRYLESIGNNLLFDPSIHAIVVNSRDVTDRKHSETELKQAHTQLIEAEKSATLVKLAAGAAHEVKNPLAILLQGLNYLSKKIKDKDESVALIFKDMEDAVKRADTTIKSLLDLSAPSELELAQLDVSGVVESSLLLVKHILDQKHIRVIKKIEPKIFISGDRNRLAQVFINIFTNAVDAMDQSGTLTVKAHANSVPVPKGASSLVLVEIEDTGGGIPEDVLPQIFEPFFTTKRGKGGTGLGLPLVRSMLKMHGGTVEIKNRPNQKGVRVLIQLPLHTPVPQTADPMI